MMKRTGLVVALALGLMSQGVMAKTLNVVTSFSMLGDMVQQVGGEHVNVIRWSGRTAIRIPSNRRRKTARC
jgi:ABC-type Zn uptake system ZnuABC Zn-binding protein ZnuA